MAQFKDGDSRTINGVTYVRTNGSWLPKVGGQFAAPTLPYEGPQAAANLQRTQQEVRQAEATAAATTAKAKADAQTAELAAKQAQEQWNINHPSPTGAEGLSGPAYLHTLEQTDPGRAAYVKALSEGRVPFPSPMMMRTPAGQALLTQVMRADPTIDATNYTTRASARTSAATGRLGQSDNALITAIGHAARLQGLAPDVFGEKFVPFNWLANTLDSSMFGGKQPTYEQNARQLGSEVAQAYGQGTGGERGQVGGDFSVNLATGQKLDNIHGAIDLMASKLAANRAQFAYGNGQLGKPDFMLLPQQTRDQLLQVAPDVAAKYFSNIPVMSASSSGEGGGGNGGGGLDHTNYGNVTPATESVTKSFPEASAFIDSLVANNIPYGKALDQFNARFPGATPFSPTQYNDALQYHAKHPSDTTGYGAATLTTPLSGAERAINKAVNFAVPDSTPVIGGFSPGTAAISAGNAAAFGLPMLAAGDQGKFAQGYMNATHPGSQFLGDLAGMTTGMGLTGKALGVGVGALADSPYAGAAARFLAKSNGIRGAAGNATYGGIYGAASNPDNPGLGAVLGAGTSLAGDAAGRFLIAPLGRGIAKGGGMFGYSPPSPLSGGERAIMKPLANPDSLSGVQQNLSDAANLGLPYSLADANPQLRALAGSAARKNADVMALANNTLNPRALGQAERAIGAINQHLAPVTDVPTAQADILKAAQDKSAPLYDAAKSQPVPEMSSYPALQEVLDRPAGQAAIRKGYDAALNNGEDVGTLTYATDANGNTVASGNPSWNVIHYARQALDANGETAVRRALDKQIATINPGFKAADAAYSTAIKGSDALQAGADATKIGMTPEATQASMGSFPNNLPQFQQGYASNLADLVERQRLSGNPYNAIYGSPLQQAKVGSVFPSGAPNFNRLYNLENDMAATRGEVLGGSQTAARTEADKAFDSIELGNALAKGAVSGGTSIPFDVAEVAARKGSNFFANRMSAARAGQIGPILLNQNPLTVSSALDDMIARNAAYQRYLQASRNAGGMFGAAGLLPFIPQGQ